MWATRPGGWPHWRRRNSGSAGAGPGRRTGWSVVTNKGCRMVTPCAVSYTHLDVYKRQRGHRVTSGTTPLWAAFPPTAPRGSISAGRTTWRLQSTSLPAPALPVREISRQALYRLPFYLSYLKKAEADGVLYICLLYTSRCV